MSGFSINSLFGQNKRTALIRKNILFSFLIKGWSGVVTLWLVSLTLKCLGEYNNGVWLMISSTLVQLDNLDIGLGNGLRNKLAEFIAQGDDKRAREAVSSTFFMLMLIVIPAVILLILIVRFADVYSFFSCSESLVPGLRDVLVVTLVFVGSTFIFKFLGNFYLGLQMPAVNNFFVTAGHTIALIGTYVLYLKGIHSLMLIAVVNTASPLIIYLLSYPYTFYVRYSHLRPSFSCFNFKMSKGLLSLGVKFFMLQTCSMFITWSSNLLMSRYFSPSMVTPYNVAWRYFSVVMMVFTVFCAPNWTATTDAYARGDMEWIANRRKHMSRILLVFAVMLSVMLMSAPFVYDIWIGSGTKVPFVMNVSMATYVFVLIWSMSYCYFLNGIGVLRLQMCCTVGAGLAFVPVTMAMSAFTDNIAFIIISMILVNLPSLICNKIQLGKILNGTASGIWLK